jgi:hypothetical protein
VVAALAMLGILAWPSPGTARADVPCDVGTAPLGAASEVVGSITGGAIGGGNPVGDVCDEVSGAVTGAITAPVTGALKGLGDDVFGQLTDWVAQGAGWLMGQVVGAIDTSTTPNLESHGFLVVYAKMAAIAVLLGAAMFLWAILEGIAQGNAGLLARVVFVNLPVAFIGTSVAFVVVQLLLGATDGLCHVIASGNGEHGTKFFEAAIGDLGKIGGDVAEPAGPGAQAQASVAVPLFVGFLAAIVGAFAAFLVWIEMEMRDAAVYAVALFLPLALAAWISPRWSSVLRRFTEILVAVIESKFIIVSIIALSGALITEEGASIERVLVATALMCICCFAPFFLLRVLTFSEGAIGAAYGRRSGGSMISGAASRGMSNVNTVRNMMRSHEGSGVSLWNAEAPPASTATPGSDGEPTGSGARRPTSGEGARGAAGERGGKGDSSPGGGLAGTPAGGDAEGAGGAGAAAGGVGALAGAGVAAGKAAGQAGEHLADTGVARSASSGGSDEERPTGAGSSGSSSERPGRPDAPGEGDGGGAPAEPPAPAGVEGPPRPSPQQRLDIEEGSDRGEGGGSS